MQENQQVLLSYKAQIFDEKIQNKILLSKLRQKDQHIKILEKSLSKYKLYCNNLKLVISGKKNTSNLITEENNGNLKKKIKEEINVPEELRSNLNPLAIYPRHDKESRKDYCKNKKFQ